MTQLTSVILGGLALGAIYSLVSLGVVIIFRANDTFNFAHGSFMALGAFIVGKWQNTDVPFALLALVSVAGTGVLGGVLYRVVLQRTLGRMHFVPVIATMGFAAILDGVMRLVFGSETYSIAIPGLPSGAVDVFGARISSAQLLLTPVVIGVGTALALGFRYTAIGVRVRAAGQNALLASQGGVNVHALLIGSWVLGSALAGAAGIIYGSTNIVSGAIADQALLAFPAALLGGLDSISGALLGGILIGLLQSAIASYLGGEYVFVGTYSLLLIVMLVIPHGLMGTRSVSRV